ncbi:ABC transporter permease [Leuconostoc sp. C2]|uniref:ABC transporter permease n=1 Tax=Leuconostoc sp. (strain C2) TaxID=979982 RepID=UPI0002174E6B|nr:ABC transporter permease [Leuconostoc sp. C2]AEJ31737.1 putative transporter, trans-membrane domain bacteriocin immunity protein [Leuconostoc sp. C2]
MQNVMSLMYAEHLKNKRSMSMTILLVGSFLGLLLGTFLYTANKQVFIQSHTQWLALWGESNLFASQVFIPLFLGIIVANNIKNELDNNNLFRIVVSPMKVTHLVMAKWLYVAFISLINQVVGFLIFVIMGYLLHLPGSVSMIQFVSWAILGWFGSLGVIAIQIWIAIKVKNFTTSLLVNFGTIIFGLIISIINSTLGDFYPYNQIMIGLHAKSLISFDHVQIVVFLLVAFLSTIVGLVGAGGAVKRIILK